MKRNEYIQNYEDKKQFNHKSPINVSLNREIKNILISLLFSIHSFTNFTNFATKIQRLDYVCLCVLECFSDLFNTTAKHTNVTMR